MSDAGDRTADHDRIVVGGSLAGLAYAWWRARRGERVLVLEPEQRLGRPLRTERAAGFRLEWGAPFLTTWETNVLALARDLPSAPAIEESGTRAPPCALRRAGLRPLPLPGRGTALRGPFLAWLAEALRAPRPSRPSRPETLAAFATRRLGAAGREDLARPLSRALLGAEPEEVGLADAAPVLAALEARRGGLLRGWVASRNETPPWRPLLPEGGLEAIARALHDALGDRVRTGAAVASLLPGDPEEGPGQPVAVRRRDGTALLAAEVALALEPDEQARALESRFPLAADALAAARPVPLVTVALGLGPRSARHLPDSPLVLRGRGARARFLRAVLLSRIAPSCAPSGCGLVRMDFGGTVDRGALDLDDETLLRAAQADLRRVLGGGPDVVHAEVRREGAAAWLPAPGARGRMARLEAALGTRGLRLLGPHVAGPGLDAVCGVAAPPRAPLPPGVEVA